MLKQEYLIGILLSATKLLDVNVKGIELVAWLAELAVLDDIAEEELLEDLLDKKLLDDEELLDDESASLLFELELELELEAGIESDD